MAPLYVSLGIALALAAVAALLVLGSRRGFTRQGSDDESELVVSAGPIYGLTSPAGPNYAPQPVFGSMRPPSPAYQPHRPMVTSPTTVRVQPVGGGAHRRDSDAAEIARLHALHEVGALSDDELASLKGRLA